MIDSTDEIVNAPTLEITEPVSDSKRNSLDIKNESQITDSTVKLSNKVPLPHKNTYTFFLKNSRQPLSLLPAYFQFFGIGMMVFKVQYIPAVQYYAKVESYAFHTLFYAGIILGALPTAFILKKFKTCLLYYISSMALIASFMITFGGKNLSTYHIGGSFLSGLSFGILILTFLSHSAEISIKEFRATNIAIAILTLNAGIYFGALVHSEGFQRLVDDFEITGIVLLVCGLLAIILTYFLCIESPIYYWNHDQIDESKKILLKLRNEIIETDEIEFELNDIRATVLCQAAIFNFVKREDIIPFIKIFLYRFGYILATGLPINMKLIKLIKIYFNCDNIEWHLIFLPKFISNILTIYNIEQVGRRIIFLISYSLSGLTLVAIAIIVMMYKKVIDFDDITTNATTTSSFVLTILIILVILNQVFLGLGPDTITYIYMAEAFAYDRKNFINLFLIVIESFIHIIIIVSIDYTDSIQNFYVCITGLLQLWIAGIAIKYAPETRNTSLLDAQHLFRNKD